MENMHKLFVKELWSSCQALEGPAREAGWEVFDIGTAAGLAEAAYYELLHSHEIVVPLLLKVETLNQDQVREVFFEFEEIQEQLNIISRESMVK